MCSFRDKGKVRVGEEGVLLTSCHCQRSASGRNWQEAGNQPGHPVSTAFWFPCLLTALKSQKWWLFTCGPNPRDHMQHFL